VCRPIRLEQAVSPSLPLQLGATEFGNGTNMQFWSNNAYVFPTFGTGSARFADSATGPGFSIYVSGVGIYVDYASNTFISGSIAYLNQI
jgi:hypothetical protein